MEIMDVLHWLSQNHELATKGFFQGIIPTVFIPLTALTVGLTSLASLVAGWFGIKLHTEGPKQFLEVLLKKRVLVSMIILNITGWGIYKSYVYVRTLPSFLYTIEHFSKKNARSSSEHYPNSPFRKHNYESNFLSSPINGLKLINETKIPKGAFRSGVISGESIFYGSDDGNIYEFNKSNLNIKRKFYIGTQVTTRPIIYKNKIFAGEGNHDTHHARIYAFDLTTGKFINAFMTTGHTEGQPIIETFENNEVMFATGGIDGLYAINPTTMEKIWHRIDGHLDATVSVENGIIYSGTGVEKGASRDRSYAVAYEFNTGKTIWKKELPLSSWMHPVITKKDVCFVLGEIYVKSSIGLLHCLDKVSGNPHFSIPFDAPLTSKPLYLKNQDQEFIFLADINGNACGVNLNTKEKLWCHSTSPTPINGSFSSFEYSPQNGLLWFSSYNNGLYAIEPKNGKIMYSWLPTGPQAKWRENYAAVSIDGDKIYQMDIDGNLRMFQVY
jgi:outer membrane protein assembly factor BamB